LKFMVRIELQHGSSTMVKIDYWVDFSGFGSRSNGVGGFRFVLFSEMQIQEKYGYRFA
jgi:hypothetical protein